MSNVIDSSGVQLFLDCERKFFYERRLGWIPDRPNHHLLFGEAIHRGMAVIHERWNDVLAGKQDEVIQQAYAEFNEVYSKAEFNPAETLSVEKKNSEQAMLCFINYINKYESIDRFELLHSEVAGKVPIDSNRVMSFRIDAILKDSRGIFVREHKTTGWSSSSWEAQFRLSTQIGLYTHVLYSLYDPKDVWGVEINGLVFKAPTKNQDGVSFQRVPVRRTREQMAIWYSHLQRHLDRIEDEDSRLEGKKENIGFAGSSIFDAFPLNERSCTKYNNICPYHDFCEYWSNPLTQSLPMGFKVEFWDPTKDERGVKERIDL